MAIPRRWRRIGLAAFAVGAAVALGVRSREDRLSCHLCRSRKEVRSAWLLILPVSRRETISHPGRLGVGRGHDWWRYSHYYSDGLGGCLGSGVRCKTARYRDDTAASQGTVLPPDR